MGRLRSTGLSSPVAIAFRKGATGSAGTMYVAEQGGTFRRIVNGHASGIALDLRANLSHGNEQGFLGAAFSPDGKRLYVDYTDANGDTNVDEYTMKGDDADASTRRRVLFVDQPYANHNGGEVVFGPDGELYIGFGDGGSAGDPHNNAQNLGVPLGKILRIDPKRAGTRRTAFPPTIRSSDAPARLPRTGCSACATRGASRSTARPAISGSATSARASTRRSTLRRTGQHGINWGWSQREGNHEFKGARPAGARDPIVETTHDDGWCAIVGGYVYRGRAIPALARRVPLRRQLPSEHRSGRATSGTSDRVARPRHHRRVAHDVRRGRSPASSISPRAAARSTSSPGVSRGVATPAERLRTAAPTRRVIPCGVTIEKLPSTLLRPPGIAIALFFASASRPARATSSASCHMNPGRPRRARWPRPGIRCA